MANFVAGEVVAKVDGHEVKCSKDGHLYCSCPSWKFQKKAPKDRVCKHLRTLSEETGISEISLRARKFWA